MVRICRSSREDQFSAVTAGYCGIWVTADNNHRVVHEFGGVVRRSDSAVMFRASDESSFIAGSDIDGGSMAW